MNEPQDIEGLIKLLNEELGLTSYESKAYTAVLLHGPDQEALVLPPERESQLAVWMKLPQFTEIMYERFETIWKEAGPALPLLKRLMRNCLATIQENENQDTGSVLGVLIVLRFICF